VAAGRDLALAAITGAALADGEPRRLRNTHLLNACVDLADALAFAGLIGGKAHDAGVRGVAGGLSGTALGVLAAALIDPNSPAQSG